VSSRTHESPAALTYGASAHTTPRAEARSHVQHSTGPRAAAARRVVVVVAPLHYCPPCHGRLLREPWPRGERCTWACLNCAREYRIVDGEPVLFARKPTDEDKADLSRRPHTGMRFHGFNLWEEETR
jgi:uncharacterized protein YbaR (Trm112 family)